MKASEGHPPCPWPSYASCLSLLLQQFLLAGNVTAVALGQHILADGTDASGGV